MVEDNLFDFVRVRKAINDHGKRKEAFLIYNDITVVKRTLRPAGAGCDSVDFCYFDAFFSGSSIYNGFICYGESWGGSFQDKPKQ